LAEQFDAKAFASVQALLDNVDAVSICSANNAHAAATIQALDAGKHVLCEKPMATTLADCEAMVEAARRNGKYLMLGHNQVFSPAHVRARKLIEEGEIGKPLMFHTMFAHSGPEVWTGTGNTWFFDRKRAALGALADLGIHKTDLIQFLLGEDIVKVSAIIKTMDKTYPDGAPITVDDNALCLYETESGAIGHLHVSWTLYRENEDNSTKIYGTEGVIRIYDDPNYSLIVERKDGTSQKYDLEQITTNADQKAGKRTSTGVVDAFVAAITEGKYSPANGEQALKAMRVVFAAEESAKTGRMVEVKHH
ncbi:MAG: Gfo/Idh/MocA family oxidoreductase, partial [Clostridia bacterium]|nr:Gfo/Idh/MocA family oxidoreductase [Clostridia bacterium]